MSKEKIARVAQLQLNKREKTWIEKIFSIVMVPILIFNLCSINFLFLGVKTAQAADGSGHMTIDKDTVAAGGTQDYRLTFDPTEAMDGGGVKVEVPAGWTAPSDTCANVTLTKVPSDGTQVLALSCNAASRTITVNITTLASNQGFYLTLDDFQAPTTAGNNTFDTESKISAGGSYRNVSDAPTVTVTPGVVASYQLSTIADQEAGNNFTITVTARDVNNNKTNGSADVEIRVKAGSGTGTLAGDTHADTSTDGDDTVTLRYSKAENGVRLEAVAGAIDDDSNSFNVNPIDTPTISSPADNIKDSTPRVTWAAVSTDTASMTYEMSLKAKESGVACASNTYAESDELYEGSAVTYTLSAAQAILDETDYCVKVEAKDALNNESVAYKQFHLSTAKPATPSAVAIDLVGDVSNNGHPANTINIYNNETVAVRVTHGSGLDQGKAYVSLSDGLGNTVTGNATIIGSGTTSTTVSNIDADSLQQGTITVKARVEDAATNSSDWTAGTSMTKDTNPPARPTSVTFLDTPVNIGNQNAVNLRVVGENGAEAYYSVISSGGAGTVTDHFTMSGATTDSPDKNMSSLPDGTLTASVYLADSAWNHGNPSTGTVLKDATNPSFEIQYYFNDALTKSLAEP